MKDRDLNYECVRLSEKILFEEYISKQLKLELMLKLYPSAVQLYIENSPEPPTIEDIIEKAKRLVEYIDGSTEN